LDIYSLGFKPTEFSTACWRGYIATYAIYRNNLVLKNLYTNNGSNLKNEAPKLNNKLPEISIDEEWVSEETRKNRREFKYRNVNLPVLYTGSIIITKDFIWDRYIHMGFQSPFSYEIVIQLTFKDGKIISSKNLSDIAKSIREKKMKPPEINDDENYISNLLNWINDCFNISFDKKVNKLLNDNKNNVILSRKSINKLKNLYINCMNCTINCKNIYKNIPNGIPPRGFYFKNIPIKILIVGKNPGHPLKNEKAVYKNKKGKNLFLSYRTYQENLYSNILLNTEKSTTFHKNLFRYISFFLDISNEINEIYNYVAHTNLLKCSTKDEQLPLNKCKEAVDTCFNTYLLNEIENMQPKILLALGKEVYEYLNKKDLNIPIIYIKHPSYYYKKNEEKEILLNIKNEIRKYI
jgi:uracil-DNA glycosylase